MELDKAALDRWITREPDEPNCEDPHCSWPECSCGDEVGGLCNYCGQDACECDKLQAEQEAEAQRLIY